MPLYGELSKQFTVVTTVAWTIENILVFQFVDRSDPRLPKYIMKVSPKLIVDVALYSPLTATSPGFYFVYLSLLKKGRIKEWCQSRLLIKLLPTLVLD